MQQQTGSKLQNIILTHCREEVLMLLPMSAILIMRTVLISPSTLGAEKLILSLTPMLAKRLNLYKSTKMRIAATNSLRRGV